MPDQTIAHISKLYCMLLPSYKFYSENTQALFSTRLRLVSTPPYSQRTNSLEVTTELMDFIQISSFQSNKPVKEMSLRLLVFASLLTYVKTIFPEVKRVDTCDTA